MNTNEFDLDSLEISPDFNKPEKQRKTRVKKPKLEEIESYITYLPECPYPTIGQKVTDSCGIEHTYLGKNKWKVNLKFNKDK